MAWKKVEKIIGQMARNPERADDGWLANRLLDEFHNGAPLEYLGPLLLSNDSRIADVGAWIASELGKKGKPLLDVVVDLLNHPHYGVRFWIIDCILLWADESKGQDLSKAVRLIDDPHKSVRWKTMCFLSQASRTQLAAALTWLTTQEPQSPNALGLRWLLSDSGRDVAAVEAMLQNTEPRREDMLRYADPMKDDGVRQRFTQKDYIFLLTYELSRIQNRHGFSIHSCA